MNDQRLADVEREISVVIGSTEMLIRQRPRMGRGEVIERDATTEDDIWILANNKLIAPGRGHGQWRECVRAGHRNSCWG